MSAKHSTRALFGRLLREAVRPYAGRIALAIVAMAIAAGAQGLTAWLMEPVVDQVFSEKDKTMLWPVAVAVLATFAVKGIAEYSQSGLMSHVGLRAIADLQNRLYAHLTRQDVAFFQAHKTGSLVSRFLVDVNLLRAAVSNAITGIGKDALTAGALIGVMFYQDWVLASAAFLVFPIAIYPVARLGRRMRKVSVNTQEQMGAFNTLLEQSFAGIRMVKAYRMEQAEQQRVAALTDTVYRLTQKGALTRAASSPIMETMGGLAVTVVIVYGGLRVIEGVTTTGAFFSFITALMMAYRPLKSLANLNTIVQEGLGAAQRLFDVLDTKPAITDAPDARPLRLSGGHVRLEGVTFHYAAADDERPALRGLDLDIPAGKTVALVGPSGAGKSTVMNMIPRFYDATEGRVTVDGQDIRSVTLESLRDAVALVSQEVVLFDDTVAANIGFGKPGATRDEVEAAGLAMPLRMILSWRCLRDTTRWSANAALNCPAVRGNACPLLAPCSRTLPSYFWTRLPVRLILRANGRFKARWST